MNKKLLKSIACIASGVAIATSIPFTTTSCGSKLTISYTNEASKDFGEVTANEHFDHHSVSSVGTITTNFSFADATWVFDVKCTDTPALTPKWGQYLSLEVKNDKKILVTATDIDQRSGTSHSFEFSLHAKIDGKNTNTISGFTLVWHC